MKFYLAVAFVSMGVLGGFPTHVTPATDEETLKNLELEWSKCSNFTQKDADCFKAIMGPSLVILDPLGVVNEFTKENIDGMYAKVRTDNPNGKSTYEYSNIKVHVFGDTGIVTYNQKTTSTGYSDPKFNIVLEMSVVDTWHKESGKWKALVSANVSRHSIPPEHY